MELTNERAILGSIMLEPTVLSVVYGEGIRQDTFFDHRHGELYAALLGMQTANRNIDYVTVYNYLEEYDLLADCGGIEYVGTIGDEFPSVHLIKDYCRAQLDVYVGHRVEEMARGLLTSSASGAGLLALASEGLSAINAESSHSEIYSVKDCIDGVVESVISDKGLLGLKTHYEAIDNIIMGLPPRALITVASRPGMGKSALALNVMKRMAEHGEPSAIFTMEMTRDELTMRLLSMESNVSTDFLKSGTLGSKGIDNVKRARDKLRTLPIYIEDSSSTTIFSLSSTARRLVAEYGIKMLAVDYLQLMDTEKDETRNLEIGRLTRGLKRLAGELGIPIIAISQLNRNVDSRADPRPNLSDLRESGNIEQDSDLVVFLFRRSYYDPVQTNDSNAAEIIVAKNRGGRMGTAQLMWEPTITTFKDIRR